MTAVSINGTNLAATSAVIFGSAALTTPHGGSYSAQLQWSYYGLDAGGLSYLFQPVTLPASGPLHLAYWVKDFCIDGPTFDYIETQIQDSAGRTLRELVPPQSQCSAGEGVDYQRWTQQIFDISDFAGQTVQLWFGAHGDAYSYADTSYFFLDDVAVQEAPGLVVNGGFETGDLTGWSVGANPRLAGYPTSQARGFLPRVTWGFGYQPGVDGALDTITALTPPQPAGLVDVLLAYNNVSRTGASAADHFNYVTTGAFDHYALRIEPGRIAPPSQPVSGGAAVRPAVLNDPGVLGPLNAGVSYPNVLTLYGVDAAGNDVGGMTLPAGDSLSFGGPGLPPSAPSSLADPCAGGPRIGGVVVGLPVSITRLPAVLDVTTCRAEVVALAAAAASGRSIRNAGSITLATRGGTPASAAATVTSGSSVAAGSTVQVAITATDAYGNGATGTAAFTGSTSPQQAPGCVSTAPQPAPRVRIENGTATTSVPVFAAGDGLAFRLYGALPGSNEYSWYTGVDVRAAATITPLAASRFWLSPAGVTVTAGGSAVSAAYAADAYCNVVTAYAGSATLGSTDPRFSHAGPARFTGGVFSDGLERLYTAGQQSITLTDTRNRALTGSALYSVQGAAPTGAFSLAVPQSMTPGAFTIKVSGALDAYGNPANGTVDLAPSGGGVQAVAGCTAPASYVPGSINVSNGAGDAQGSLSLAGTYTLTASDGTGQAQQAVTVNPGPASVLVFNGLPSSAGAGQPIRNGSFFEIDVTDGYCNAVGGGGGGSLTADDATYSGGSTPSAGTTPGLKWITFSSGGVYRSAGEYLFSAGSHHFTATYRPASGLAVTSTSAAISVVGTVLPCPYGVPAGSSATWNAAGSPYTLNCDVVVDGRLTVDGSAGEVDVQVAGAHGILVNHVAQSAGDVSAALIVAGTAAHPVRFYSTNPAPGAWTGIDGYDNTESITSCCRTYGSYRTLNMAYATITNAVRGVYWSNYAWDASAANTSGVVLDHVTITGSGTNALNLQNTNAAITNSTFTHTAGTTAAVFLNSPAGTYPNQSFRGNTITGNGGYGIEVANSAQTVTCALISGNRGGLLDDGSPHAGTRLADSDIYGNGASGGPYELASAAYGITSTGNYWGSGGYAAAFNSGPITDSGDLASPSACAGATPMAILRAAPAASTAPAVPPPPGSLSPAVRPASSARPATTPRTALPAPPPRA